MIQYKDIFDKTLRVKSEPNALEKELFVRSQKYIGKLTWIPGIEMIAVVNSLSMYATHKDSDIDLFIVTKPCALWLVRFCVTCIFWLHGVWRKGTDIRGNFCLSFFVTTDVLNMENIAIEDDIYLYFWTFYLKPILVRGDIYEQFVFENSWVDIPMEQIAENKKYIRYNLPERYLSFFWRYLDEGIRLFGEKKTLISYQNAGKPEGIILSRNMLKFHKEDRRKSIRDDILRNRK